MPVTGEERERLIREGRLIVAPPGAFGDPTTARALMRFEDVDAARRQRNPWTKSRDRRRVENRPKRAARG